MEKTLSSQSREWKEGCRLRAWELKQLGWKQTDIATALGVTPGAVSQWMTRAEKEGVEGLYRHKAPGGKPRLSAEQKAKLPGLLSRGAEAFDFRGDVWTRGRVGTVIQREFGVSYDPSQVGRILCACGWSLQRPIRRAKQRDEEAIRRWKEEGWPEAKKRP